MDCRLYKGHLWNGPEFAVGAHVDSDLDLVCLFAGYCVCFRAESNSALSVFSDSWKSMAALMTLTGSHLNSAFSVSFRATILWLFPLADVSFFYAT
jgi:hypothetical protein